MEGNDSKRKQNFEYSARHIRRKRKLIMSNTLQEINSRILAAREEETEKCFDEDNYFLDNNVLKSQNSSETITIKDSPVSLEVCSVHMKKTNDNIKKISNSVSCKINTDLTTDSKLSYNSFQNKDSPFIENDFNLKCTQDLLPENIFLTTIESLVDHENIFINENYIFDDSEFNYRYSDDDSDICDEEEFVLDSISDANKEASEKRIISAYNENCDDFKKYNDSDEVNMTENISKSLKSILAPLAVENNLKLKALSQLLHSIRNEIRILNLPLDPRTLLKTPRNTQINLIKGGQYCHFGLSNCLEKIIEKRLFLDINTRNIDLIVNTDGVPLGSSSEKNLWPILCSESLFNDVYIIGVYCGQSKPKDANEFLSPFVLEAKEFVENGIYIDDIQYNVNIHAFVLDAPAKAYVLAVKYNSGYDCCTKYTIEGTMYRCVCFPGKMGSLRTDEELKNYAY